MMTPMGTVMKDEEKSRDQLLEELKDMRRYIAYLSKQKPDNNTTTEGGGWISERMEHLLTAGPGMIYAFKASGTYLTTFISPNVRERLGYDPSEFTDDSDHWLRNIHPEDVKHAVEGLGHLFDSGHHHRQYRFRHKDGSWRWMLDELRLVRNAAGDPLEIIGCWTDITQQKQTEEACLASEKKYREILEVSPIPMLLIDERQSFSFINPAFTKTFGYALEDIPTLSHWWVQAYPETAYRKWVADTWQARIEDAKQTGTAFSPLEAIVRCKDETQKVVMSEIASFSTLFDGEIAIRVQLIEYNDDNVLWKNWAYSSTG